MPKTFLFDLDGTLIDSPPIILETFQEIFLKHFKDISLDHKTLTTFLGKTLFKTFKEYTEDDKFVDQLVIEYRNLSEQKVKEKLSSYPTAIETLKTLKSFGHNIGIVTSKMNYVAKKHLEITGLLSYVDLIIGYEDVKEHKPNPEGLLIAMKHFNANKNDTIYVGDHENDILAAKKANIKAVLVFNSLRLLESLKAEPDLVINSLFDLTEI
jgi:HAD superfamily hydrolase (TIGR01662 family)